MKVAVVGLGYWGPNLVRNLHVSNASPEVVACDLDEERLKGVLKLYPSTKGVTDLDDVLSDADVDAVVIATPVRTHVALATRCLEAGKSVLVEKPLATSREEAQRLVDLARERGLLVMAGHTFLFSPPVRVIRNMILSGEIGNPLYVQSSRINLGIHQSDVSVLWDLAPHDLSILFEWLGETPDFVSAHGRSTQENCPPDVAFIDLAFPSGCVANLHLSWLAPTKMRRMTLVGARRMVVYEDTNPEEPVKVYDKGIALPAPEDFGQYKLTYRTGDVLSPRVESWEPLRAELETFMSRVAQGDVPDRREEDAVAVVATIEAAERSLEQRGEPISL